MSKAFPQGLESGEEFRDDDIIGMYKPSDTASSVDGTLNKSKTWLEVQTWIEDDVIADNTANIATNATDIDSLETRATTNESDIDALETRATTNESDIDTLESNASTTSDATFASVNTGYGANEVVPEDVYYNTNRPGIDDLNLSTIEIKQTAHIAVEPAFSGIDVNLPSTGTYSYIYSYWDESASTMYSGSSSSSSAGTTIMSITAGDYASITYRRIS